MLAEEKDLALKEELDFFESKREEWLKIYEGKFALIKGTELIDTFSTFEQAYQQGVDLFGNESFLIKPILKEDRVETVPALTLGIIHANL